ncbi:MAG: M1 family metallopeptidase [Planctomycetota bacterium]|nr:M1 family metallopeptidase [Planctomycetota bacterium]
MHTRRLLPLITACLLSAAATSQGPPETARVVPYPIDLPNGFKKAIGQQTRTLLGRPGAEHWTNYAHYDIALTVDPAKSRVQGTAKMTYENRSPDTLDRLIVHCYQDMMKAGTQRTRFVTATNGLEVTKVMIGDDAVRSRARDTKMTLRLPEKLASGETVTVTIDYAFDIPKAGTAPRMGYEGDRVIYLGYWYPQFAVYDDVEGWVADPYRGNGEFYMDYADYDLAITAPTGYIVRATGVLQNPADVLTEKAMDRLDAARETRDVVRVVDAEDLKRGEATKSSQSGQLTWKFHAENVRDAAVSLGKTYVWDATHAVVKDKHGEGRDGVCMIHAVYETNAGDWVRGAEYARHTIEYMSEMVHPYPWPHMTACEGIIGGGMEYPMMTIIGGRRPAGTIAHELIHMWFPMLLGSNEKRYAWQDEGFTSFWTTLCRDDFQNRKNGPKGALMSTGSAIGRGRDVVCMRHGDTYGTESFGFASYSKPAAILHQLRGLLGDEVFFRAFREYARDWAFKHPYPYDFFHTFERVSRRDLQAYFRTWFFEKWALDHAIEDVKVSSGGTAVTVRDMGRAVMPAVVEVVYEDESTERKTVDEAAWWKSTEATLKFRGKAVEVRIDPDVITLDANRRNNRWRAERK